MARLDVNISASGTTAYIQGSFTGGSDSYSYPKLLYVDIYGYGVLNIISNESSGGSNTFYTSINDLDYEPAAYDWYAVLYVRDSNGSYIYNGVRWSATSYRDEGQFDAGVSTVYYAYLSFNANGGSGAPSTIYNSDTNDTGYLTFDIPDTVPTRDGYQFLGWATNSSGTGTLRQPGETYTGYGSTSYPGPRHTLYAAWKQITTWYAYVQFNANGGSGAPSTVYGQSSTGEYVQLNIPSTKPTRTNYIFLGWSLTKTATTADYYPNGTITVYGSGSSPGTKYVLYAIWQESSGDSYAWINVGGGTANWHMAIPWINTGGGTANWHKTIPWINNGGGTANWKKGMS